MSLPSALVVDDEPDIATLLATRLRRLGWQVRTVGSGEAAVEAALDQPPTLLVLDVLLPGIDGWETLRRLRAEPRLSGLHVIVVSICEPTTAADGLDVAAHLVKPFSAADIARAVSAAVCDLPVLTPARPLLEDTA